MWTLQDAKNRFSTVVDAALAGTPQEVTRRGKPAVVIMSASEYHQLLAEAQRARGSFVGHLLAFPVEDVERAKVEPRPVDF
jgi:prevent-host-death family protein